MDPDATLKKFYKSITNGNGKSGSPSQSLKQKLNHTLTRPRPHTRRRKTRKMRKPRASRGVSHYNLVRKSDKLGCGNNLY